MAALFPDHPEALASTVRIAEMCDFTLKGVSTLPAFDVPPGFTTFSYFEKVTRDGFADRRRALDPLAAAGRLRHPLADYEARLDKEIGVIHRVGFSGYFLIVWDFIRYAKERRIPVGPGRGSAAGSLVAWALRITDIDPIENDLIFERFLNEERISPPDIDIDFCEARRGEVIEYVTKKYGRDNVAQIITFGTMKAKAVVRDVGRVMDMSYAEVDKIAKMIPFDLKMTLDKALAESPPLQDAYQKEPRVKELIDISRRLEGTTRHASTHAAGVVISPVPLTDLVPLFKGNTADVTTQFDMKGVERIGLLKMDFLGLRTLTLIDNCVKMLEAQRGIHLDPADIPLDDAKTYELFTAGRTSGLFQFESDGMRDILKRFKPDQLEHLTALNALYRPGPMQMIDDFIKRRHGQTRVSYEHPALEPILKGTYGVMVYQEQVMQIASALAGFTLGEADILRKAMGKKKVDVMATQMDQFLKGCAGRGVAEKKARRIWDAMEQFAGYGFNKSHSAAYAWLAYQTAYLKANYPAYFVAALLTSERANTDKMVQYIGECREMGIRVLPPDVNQSEMFFSVVPDPRVTQVGNHGDSGHGLPESPEDGSPRGLPGGPAAGAVVPRAGSARRRRDRQRIRSPRAPARPTARGGTIRFGLAAIKNVGEGAVEAVLAARKEGGPFASLFDFCDRVDLRAVNRRVVESFVKSGSFDSTDPRRSALFAAIERATEAGQKRQRDRDAGQSSLFGMLGGGGEKQAAPERIPDAPPWSEAERLLFEKESLGFFISGHPLERFREEIAQWASATTGTLAQTPVGTEATVGGIVTALRLIKTKKGDRMASFLLEDLEGSVETLVFPEAYKKAAGRLADDQVVLVKGRAEVAGRRTGQAARLRGASPRAGQARRSPVRDDPGERRGLGPGEGGAAPRYTRRAPGRLPGDARAGAPRLVGSGPRPERLLPGAAGLRAARGGRGALGAGVARAGPHQRAAPRRLRAGSGGGAWPRRTSKHRSSRCRSGSTSWPSGRATARRSRRAAGCARSSTRGAARCTRSSPRGRRPSSRGTRTGPTPSTTCRPSSRSGRSCTATGATATTRPSSAASPSTRTCRCA